MSVLMLDVVAGNIAYSSSTKIPFVDGEEFSTLRDKFQLVAVSVICCVIHVGLCYFKVRRFWIHISCDISVDVLF